MKLLRKISAWFRRQKLDADMAEEMRLHLERRTEENIANGMSPTEAHYAARRAFGGVEQIKEIARDQRGWLWLEQVRQDLRHAFRSLAKAPGFTAVAILTLALGIGVNASMFSVLHALVFRQAPFPHSEQLVRIFDRSVASDRGSFPAQDVEEMHAHSSKFSALAWLVNWTDFLSEPGQAAAPLKAIYGSQDIFSVLGVQPMLGRSFTADEEKPGRTQVAILSHECWQQRFGGAPDIVGRSLRINFESVTVIGVMPSNAQYIMLWPLIDIWRPIAIPPHYLAHRDWRMFDVIARLKPGATLDEAASEFEPLAARLAKARPELNSGHRFRLLPFSESANGDSIRHLSFLLLGLSGFVLLIACANLANLQLARAITRSRELAIRSALGASRFRLIAGQLSESLLLAFSGGGLGLIVALGITGLIQRSVIDQGDHWLELPLNGTIFIFTLVVSLLTGLFFGTMPAWFATHTDANSALNRQSRSSTANRTQTRLRHGLIVAEIALALVLIAGANLMVRGFDRFLHRDHGWDSKGLLTATVNLPETTRYQANDVKREFHRRLEARLAITPGANEAAFSTSVPVMSYIGQRGVEVPGQTSTKFEELPQAGYTVINAHYFSILRIPFVAGRAFVADLHPDSPPVAIVNESLARHYWPRESAIGKRIASREADKTVWCEIIGVVRDAEFAGNPGEIPVRDELYRPFAQEPWGYFKVILRGPSPLSLIRELQKAVAEIDPDVAVHETGTIAQIIEETQRTNFLIGRGLAGFALLGLGLAAIGLYAVISHTVAQRTNEFGIRRALGAQSSDVIALVLERGIRLTLIGISLGSVGAYAVGCVLASFFPKLPRFDPLGSFVSALLLFAIALLAGWLPARKATRVDPMVALRAE